MANVNHKQQIRVLSFNAGQYSTHEPATVPQNAASELNNIYISNIGQATQVEGLKRQGDAPSTLVSEWNFNNSSCDDAEGSNDGTATDVTYVDGKFGKGAEFNGTTSSIAVAASSTIDVNTIGSLTVSAWVDADTDGEGNAGRIVDKFSGTDVGYKLWLSGSDTTPVVNFEVGYVTTNAKATTVETVTAGTWTKIDAVLEADHSINIYINGVLSTYSTDVTGVGGVNDDSAVALYIGNNSAGSATFDGTLDDVRIYNGPRTAAQVQQSKIYGLSRFRVEGTVDRLVRIVGTSLQVLDADLGDWTDIDTGFTTSLKTNFITCRASDGTYKLAILNGTDNVHTLATDLSTVVDEADTNTDPPISSYGEWHDNRLFLIDSNGDINFSDVLDCQTFDRAANIFRPKSPAIAIKSFKEKQLVVYNAKGIQILDTDGATPLTNWALTILNEDVEFNSQNTVVNLGDDQIFLARDGVRILSRTQFDKIQSGLISQPVQNIIDSINQDAIDVAEARLYNNRYYLAIPTGTNTENDTVLVWDAVAAKTTGDIKNGWSNITDWNVARFADFEFGDNQSSLVVGDHRAISLVYQHTGNHNNGAAIESEIVGLEHFVDGVSDGLFGPIQVQAHAGVATTLDVQVEVNRTGFVSIGTVDLTGGAPVLPIALPFTLGGTERVRSLLNASGIGRGRSVRVRIRHTTYNVQPTFTEYVVYSRKLNPRFT